MFDETRNLNSVIHSIYGEKKNEAAPAHSLKKNTTQKTPALKSITAGLIQIDFTSFMRTTFSIRFFS